MTKRVSKKKTNLIKTADKLFRKFGIKRVSVEEICREAEVSKMTYYKYFDNKEAIVMVVLDGIFDIAMKEFRKLLASGLPFVKKITTLIEIELRLYEEMGQNFVEDMLTYENIYGYIIKRKRESLVVITDYIRKMQDEGLFRKDLNIKLIEFALFKFWDVYYNSEEIQRLFPDEKKAINDIVELIFFGLIDYKKLQVGL